MVMMMARVAARVVARVAARVAARVVVVLPCPPSSMQEVPNQLEVTKNVNVK